VSTKIEDEPECTRNMQPIITMHDLEECHIDKAVFDIYKAITYYIVESGDYSLRLNSQSTVSVDEIIKALEEGIQIDDKKYGPYLGTSASGKSNYKELIQHKGLNFIVIDKGKT